MIGMSLRSNLSTRRLTAACAAARVCCVIVRPRRCTYFLSRRSATALCGWHIRPSRALCR
jgi:hypothetical protein